MDDQEDKEQESGDETELESEGETEKEVREDDVISEAGLSSDTDDDDDNNTWQENPIQESRRKRKKDVILKKSGPTLPTLSKVEAFTQLFSDDMMEIVKYTNQKRKGRDLDTDFERNDLHAVIVLLLAGGSTHQNTCSLRHIWKDGPFQQQIFPTTMSRRI
jgi:hypothetical protein